MVVVIVLVVALMVAIQALYVAAEFAAVSVRRSRIRQLAEEGSRLAESLLPTLEDPRKLDRYIAACQIGITISTLVLGAYGQATIPTRIAPAFESLGSLERPAAETVSAIFVLLFLTSVQVLLGELVPKSLALQFPARMAIVTAIPMRWSLVLFRGSIVVLNGTGLAILKLIRAGDVGHGHIHSPGEIELLIVQSADGGLLEPDERKRLARALALGTRDARNVMVPRNHIEFVDADDPVEEIKAQVARSPYTRLPAFRESPDNVIGILHTRDLALRAIEGHLGPIDELLRPVVTAPDSVTADRLLAILRASGSQQAIITDEFGGVAGLATLEDILAEVFGDFADEFKGGTPQVEQLPDGRIRLPGIFQVGDAAAHTGAAWSGHADTVGGLVTEVLERLPLPGEKLVIDGVEVEVESVARHAVTSILVRPIEAVEDSDDD
ncbi:MAG: hemolysin family protein [Dehalococcoidia bacterium]